MSNIIWSPRSRDDLRDIKEYISIDSPRKAKKFIDELIEYPNRLSIFPNASRPIPGCDIVGAKEVFYRDYRIAFRIVNDNIEILTIHHGSKLSP